MKSFSVRNSEKLPDEARLDHGYAQIFKVSSGT